MKDFSSSSLLNVRQDEIRRKMINALERGEERQLDLLQAQWVHRYGLATLPNKIVDKDFSVNLERTQKTFDCRNQSQNEGNNDFKKELQELPPHSILVDEEKVEPLEVDIENTQRPFERFSTFFTDCLEEVGNALVEEQPSSKEKTALEEELMQKSLVETLEVGEESLKEVGNNVVKDQIINEEELIDQSNFQRSIAPPPPPPSLNHFRRWLPVNDEELSEAS